jgi:hypothetical protein
MTSTKSEMTITKTFSSINSSKEIRGNHLFLILEKPYQTLREKAAITNAVRKANKT